MTKNDTILRNVIIITGASGGIGGEMAFQYSKRGDNLVLASRRSELLEELADKCGENGASVLVVPTDVTDPTQCENLISQAIKKFGRIDVLVNNAGIGKSIRFDAMQGFDLLEKVMRVNYFGSVYCTYYALPYLKETYGRITTVSSLGGKTGIPMLAAYTASKFAQVGFFDSLRVELAGTGVSITMVYPDTILTKGYLKAMGLTDKDMNGKTVNRKIGMDANACARLIIKATDRRKREIVTSARGRILQVAKLLAPTLIDGIAKHQMQKIYR